MAFDEFQRSRLGADIAYHTSRTSILRPTLPPSRSRASSADTLTSLLASRNLARSFRLRRPCRFGFAPQFLGRALVAQVGFAALRHRRWKPAADHRGDHARRRLDFALCRFGLGTRPDASAALRRS